MLLVLSKCTDVWLTKMNKLLFYIDFVSYRETGMAITGLPYFALDYGPVPDRWARVYSEFDEIQQCPEAAPEYSGTLLKSTTPPNLSVFSDKELQTIDKICDSFGRLSASRISELSHKEEAWLKNHQTHSAIDFKDAFLLRAI